MRSLIDGALGVLPLPVRRRLAGIGPEFLKFGVVGVLGFVVDTATVYAARGLIGIYAAGMLAYLTAATVNWYANRAWTFRDRRSGGSPGGEWARYLAANLLGFLLNRGTFVLLVATVPLCAAQPVLPVAAGALAGMLVNFNLSRTVVFRPGR